MQSMWPKLTRHIFRSRRYRWVIFHAALLVTLFIIFDVIQLKGFGYEEQYPYYSYQLGFRQPSYATKMINAFVVKTNEVALPQAVPLDEYIRNHGGMWSPNSSYRLLSKLLEPGPVDNSKTSARYIMREHYLKNLDLKSIEYEVRVINVDPLEYWRNGTILNEESRTTIIEVF